MEKNDIILGIETPSYYRGAATRLSPAFHG